ncbi:MAG: divalent-cation tolerance protein CutA [Verrucomicrobia bacterium]|nr:MAG: divalent-cation tolerance protein CutA [Verrucomicrobiota bacterium]
MIPTITPILVLCSCPDETKARQIGTLLVEKQLAACVSFAASESMYRWQGNLESATETVLTIKTSQEHFPRLRDLILAHHPYEVPEIIGHPITTISPSYLQWMQQSLGAIKP